MHKLLKIPKNKHVVDTVQNAIEGSAGVSSCNVRMRKLEFKSRQQTKDNVPIKRVNSFWWNIILCLLSAVKLHFSHPCITTGNTSAC